MEIEHYPTQKEYLAYEKSIMKSVQEEGWEDVALFRLESHHVASEEGISLELAKTFDKERSANLSIKSPATLGTPTVISGIIDGPGGDIPRELSYITRHELYLPVDPTLQEWSSEIMSTCLFSENTVPELLALLDKYRENPEFSKVREVCQLITTFLIPYDSIKDE